MKHISWIHSNRGRGGWGRGLQKITEVHRPCLGVSLLFELIVVEVGLRKGSEGTEERTWVEEV